MQPRSDEQRRPPVTPRAAIRRAGVADSRACFAIFRRSLGDLLARSGVDLSAATGGDPP